MLNNRTKKTDDYIGPSTGVEKFFHKTMMFILFPLRKPLVFLGIVLVLFLAPTFKGVKPAEVHIWYWNHIKSLYQQVADKSKILLPEASNQVVAPVLEPAVVPEVVNLPVKDTRRKMFERAKSSEPIVAVDIMKNQEIARLPKPEKAPTPTERPTPEVAKENVKKNLNLRYVDNPVTIKGYAKVINANELKIENTDLFLYGIYVDPNTAKGINGKGMLENLVRGKTVECQINAYTYQGIATGICTVGDININRTLVNSDISKNVALD